VREQQEGGTWRQQQVESRGSNSGAGKHGREVGRGARRRARPQCRERRPSASMAASPGGAEGAASSALGTAAGRGSGRGLLGGLVAAVRALYADDGVTLTRAGPRMAELARSGLRAWRSSPPVATLAHHARAVGARGRCEKEEGERC
jgi:hypothetical protein